MRCTQNWRSSTSSELWNVHTICVFTLSICTLYINHNWCEFSNKRWRWPKMDYTLQIRFKIQRSCCQNGIEMLTIMMPEMNVLNIIHYYWKSTLGWEDCKRWHEQAIQRERERETDMFSKITSAFIQYSCCHRNITLNSVIFHLDSLNDN